MAKFHAANDLNAIVILYNVTATWPLYEERPQYSRAVPQTF